MVITLKILWRVKKEKVSYFAPSLSHFYENYKAGINNEADSINITAGTLNGEIGCREDN